MTDLVERFGEGPLARVAAGVYNLLVVELLVLATSAPAVLPLVLLDRDASNVPLAAACAIPLGPSLSAALYALHHRRSDLTDLRPASWFWRGYRLNVRAVLPLWVAGLAWLAVVALTLANFGAAGLPGWWAVLLGLSAVVVIAWLTNVLVITSLFEFRIVDVARLAWYLLARVSVATLGNLGVVIIAVLVTVASSEAVLALLASVLVAVLLQVNRPTIALVTQEFTA